LCLSNREKGRHVAQSVPATMVGGMYAQSVPGTMVGRGVCAEVPGLHREGVCAEVPGLHREAYSPVYHQGYIPREAYSPVYTLCTTRYVHPGMYYTLPPWVYPTLYTVRHGQRTRRHPLGGVNALGSRWEKPLGEEPLGYLRSPKVWRMEGGYAQSYSGLPGRNVKRLDSDRYYSHIIPYVTHFRG